VRGAPRRYPTGTRYAIEIVVQKPVPISKVLRVQSLGFLAIIAVSLLNEFFDLRSLILENHPYISEFGASALEMLLVLAVWFLVVGATRRVLQRVHYLEVSRGYAPGATTFVIKTDGCASKSTSIGSLIRRPATAFAPHARKSRRPRLKKHEKPKTTAAAGVPNPLQERQRPSRNLRIRRDRGRNHSHMEH